MNIDTAIKEFAGRKEQISTARVLNHGRRRAHSLAEQMTRRGAMAASAELCNEAVTTLIGLAYEQDETGFCNIDESTGVFERFPMPWGRFYQRWGLKATERLVLQLHVKRLLELPVEPLWTYDGVTRRWGVNVFDYPTRNDAIAYWNKVQLDAGSYRMMLQTLQNRRPNGD